MGRKKRESTTFSKTFADRLSDLIEEKKAAGLSHNEICEQAGVGSGAMSDWLSDNKTANIDSLGKLANYFNVSADWMLGLSNDRDFNCEQSRVCDYIGLNANSISTLKELCNDGTGKIVLDFILRDFDFLTQVMNYIISPAWANVDDKILGYCAPSEAETQEYIESKNKYEGTIKFVIPPHPHPVFSPDAQLSENVSFAQAIKAMTQLYETFKVEYTTKKEFIEMMVSDYISFCEKTEQ